MFDENIALFGSFLDNFLLLLFKSKNFAHDDLSFLCFVNFIKNSLLHSVSIFSKTNQIMEFFYLWEQFGYFYIEFDIEEIITWKLKASDAPGEARQ